MTNKTLHLIKEIVSGKIFKSNEPIPRKKQVGSKEKIIINPEYTPYRQRTMRQPDDTGKC